MESGGTTIVQQFEATGSSGTDVSGGQFSEEYLNELRGMKAAKVWDMMRRSETQVAMLLNAVFNPIKSANWDVESADPKNEAYNLHADFIRKALFKELDWPQFIHEALTFVVFGYAVFEEVHKVRLADPQFGDCVFLNALAFRSQKTIDQWNLEKKTGKLLSVTQQAFGDVSDNSTIPGAFLTVFTLSKEGDNYEGISALRPMYGAYKRKKLYLKLAAIGLEKYAVGTPIGTIPKDKANNKKEVDTFIKVLQSYASHEKSYLTKPEGWEIEVQKNDFDVDKVVEAIKLENLEMVNSLVANFLSLGTGGSGGAFALGKDLSAFFLGCIQAFADVIAKGLDRKTIRGLIDVNFGKQAEYPSMKCTGINDKAGTEFASALKTLADGALISPDETLEEFLRKQFKIPQADQTTRRARPAVMPGAPGALPAPMPQQMTENSRTRKFADSYRKQWNENKSVVKDTMQTELASIWAQWQPKLKSRYNNATAAQRVNVVDDTPIPGVVAYKQRLKSELARVALDALEGARKEVPSKKKIKLSEEVDTLKLAYLADPFDRLPAELKRKILAQADLITETQTADLKKAVAFQFQSSAASTEAIDVILKDIDDKVTPMIEGSTKGGANIDAAAGDAVAQSTQAGRNTFFFQPEVLEEVESFTFYNEDPVSEICQDLNGQTFAANDAEAARYFPPLHHNCKSRLQPNLKGDKSNPAVEDKFGPSEKSLEKYITLDEKTGTCCRYNLCDATNYQ